MASFSEKSRLETLQLGSNAPKYVCCGVWAAVSASGSQTISYLMKK